VSELKGAAVTHEAITGHGFMELSPYGIQSKKLAMWLFIASDAITFGAVLFGYSYLRIGSPNWSYPFRFSPSIVNAFVMTVILLASSLTMLGAVGAAKADNMRKCLRLMGFTMLLGLIFALLHIREWFHMFDEGWGLFKNPLGGTPDFGAGFFCITGLHLLHVISGVIALAVVALWYKTGRLDKNHVETTGLYWHFVDIVWMFVFPVVYLMNAAR
jgi:heme/copper-type cytochrome/quinol oxidase subunit 3